METKAQPAGPSPPLGAEKKSGLGAPKTESCSSFYFYFPCWSGNDWSLCKTWKPPESTKSSSKQMNPLDRSQRL